MVSPTIMWKGGCPCSRGESEDCIGALKGRGVMKGNLSSGNPGGERGGHRASSRSLTGPVLMGVAMGAATGCHSLFMSSRSAEPNI